MRTGLAYRKTAIEGASSIGLMIALFDTLAGDLGRAAAALRRNDIEVRCREMNHASLVLGQLGSWIDLEKGGEAAENLSRFYTHVRNQMIQAAATKSAALLDAQIEMILRVRTAWQQLDAPAPQASARQPRAMYERGDAAYSAASEEVTDRIRFSQSA